MSRSQARYAIRVLLAGGYVGGLLVTAPIWATFLAALLVLMTPIGVAEWGSDGKTGHPVGYVLDWLFPDDDTGGL